MPSFDPIATPAVRSAAHRAPIPVLAQLDDRWCTYAYNRYLDPKENRSYLTRKLAYLEVLREGMREHLATFRTYPPKRVMGLAASG